MMKAQPSSYPTARRSSDEAVVLLETPNRPLAGQYSP
jgi:hypothetical protein